MEQAPGDKELRIALVMGGGVSLGTFSSGALVQLCERLCELSQTRKGRLCIDVATGASAGAMTLAVFFRYLYAGAQPKTLLAAMRDCWVDGVGMDPAELSKQLLPRLDRHEPPALLSDQPLRVLGKRHVLDFRGDGSAPELLADTAYLSFSLTNLNGLEYRAPCHWSTKGTGEDAGRDALCSTSFEDRIRFRLHKGSSICTTQAPVDPVDRTRPITNLDHDAWSQVLDAALASGAFPGAFAPVTIERFAQEYDPGVWPTELAGKAHRFSYVDGGLLNNEPLKEALGLAHRIDLGQDPRSYERVFLFVDPVVSDRTAKLRMAQDLPKHWQAHYDPERETFDYQPARRGYMAKIKSDLRRVSSVVFGQATFQDWLQLGKVNQRAEWFNEVSRVCSPYLSGIMLPAELQRELDTLARRIQASHGPAESACGPRQVEESQGAMVLLDLMTSIAGFEQKRDVNVIAVSPRSAQHAPLRLAGDFAGAFGGFFDRSFRAYDFEAGRVVMQNTLSRDTLAKGLFGATPPATLTDPPASGYEQVSLGVQAHFERVLQGHFEAFLGELGLPQIVDHLLAWRLRRGVVDRLRRPSSVQVRPLMFRITGEGVQAGQALLGATSEHSTPAFGTPLALVSIVDLWHDPQATKGESAYGIHGPELFDQRGNVYFCVDASEMPGEPRKRTELNLHPDARAWFDLAGHVSQVEVVWDGQADLMIAPK